MDLEKGGRGAIERMVEAYGFTTRQALCDQLGVSKGTLSNRYMRDSFPADWVIQCSLETGASLQWLVSGKGIIYECEDIMTIPCKKIIDGELFDANYFIFDKAFLPNKITTPFVLISDTVKYLMDFETDSIQDGKWLIQINSKYSIRDINIMPKSQAKVSHNGTSFECDIKDLDITAKVKMIFNTL
ncbi:TPA: phage repressor protein CI [Serratia marcescens]